MNQHEYEDLLDVLKEKALNGDVEALRHLGDALYQGPDGTEKNVQLAFPYWKRAVDNGDLTLALKVAYALYSGEAGYENYQEALKYFEIAADDGYVEGIYRTGYFYLKGIGCEENIAVAKNYLLTAALEDHGYAQWYLGALQMLDKEDDWLHWMCCAHLSGVDEATEYLNKLLSDGSFTRDALDYQFELIYRNGIDPRNTPQSTSSNSSGGCYVATAVYGSYDCPQVWVLRRYRDYTLAETWYGRTFIRTYYAISPTLVKLFGHTKWFKKLWKGILDKKIKTLQTNGVESTPYQDRQW